MNTAAIWILYGGTGILVLTFLLFLYWIDESMAVRRKPKTEDELIEDWYVEGGGRLLRFIEDCENRDRDKAYIMWKNHCMNHRMQFNKDIGEKWERAITMQFDELLMKRGEMEEPVEESEPLSLGIRHKPIRFST